MNGSPTSGVLRESGLVLKLLGYDERRRTFNSSHSKNSQGASPSWHVQTHPIEGESERGCPGPSAPLTKVSFNYSSHPTRTVFLIEHISKTAPRASRTILSWEAPGTERWVQTLLVTACTLPSHGTKRVDCRKYLHIEAAFAWGCNLRVRRLSELEPASSSGPTRADRKGAHSRAAGARRLIVRALPAERRGWPERAPVAQHQLQLMGTAVGRGAR